MAKINKEMVDHLLRWHLEYQTTRAKTQDMKNVFSLIKYLVDEVEALKKHVENR